MASLYCPRCGQRGIDLLGNDDDDRVFGCRACRAMFSLVVFATEYCQFVEEGPLPLYEEILLHVLPNAGQTDGGA
jgi:hypothetical protein